MRAISKEMRKVRILIWALYENNRFKIALASARRGRWVNSGWILCRHIKTDIQFSDWTNVDNHQYYWKAISFRSGAWINEWGYEIIQYVWHQQLPVSNRQGSQLCTMWLSSLNSDHHCTIDLEYWTRLGKQTTKSGRYICIPVIWVMP